MRHLQGNLPREHALYEKESKVKYTNKWMDFLENLIMKFKK